MSRTWQDRGSTRRVEVEVAMLEATGLEVSPIFEGATRDELGEWSGGRLVALVFDEIGTDSRLIAAAPELLAALEAIVRDSIPQDDVDRMNYSFARDAVAKAKRDQP